MSSEDLDSSNYLFKLCADKKWDGIREYLKRSDLSYHVKKQQILWKNNNGQTTFSRACWQNSPSDIIESMLGIAGNEIVHIATVVNLTPLHGTCYVKVDVEVMNLLVKTGGKKLVMASDDDDDTALHYACCNDIIDVADIKSMVDIGGKELVLEQNSITKNTCLHNACDSKPTPDALKILLNKGEDDLLKSRDQFGRTPFHVALQYADNHGPQGLQVFVDAGDLELFVTKDNKGRTPISLVKRLESSEKFKSQAWKDFFVHFYKKAYEELLLEMSEISEFEFTNESLDERDIASLQNEVLKLLNKNLNKNNKLDDEVIASLETKVTKLENEKSNHIGNIKELEDKKSSDAKVIESLKTELKTMAMEKENDKANHKNAIEALQTENIEAKETIKALQEEKESHANNIATLETDKKSDAKLIEALQVENEKAKESLQSLQAEKESHVNLIQALKTEKEKIDIEKDDIRKELDASIISEYEKDKIIESLKSENSNLRQDITNMQFNMELEQEEIQDHHASKMKGLKRKIEKLESTSKEEANDAKAKRSRFFFWW